jgi:large subunit ribosomal protein L25
MKEIKVKTKKRKEVGKEAAKRLRKEGWVPAILYGHGEETLPILVDGNTLPLFTESSILSMKVDGDASRKTLVKEIQRDFITGEVLHVDFQLIHEHEKITVEVSINLEGHALGVKDEGGTLEHFLRSVQVRCLPSEIPPEFRLDVSQLKIGDVIHVKELVAQYPNVAIDEEPEQTVLTITPPKVEAEVVEAVPEEEEKEPELIGKEKKEEDDEEGKEQEEKKG